MSNNPDQEQLDKWTNGNFERLRYEYPLNKDSVCLDLGAFHCEWAIKISEMYNNPTIYSFEAVESIYNVGKENIINNTNIKLFNFGVGKEDLETKIYLGPSQGVSTSLFIESDKIENIIVRSIKNVLNELHISSIDLIKINIEGSEYDVLECLIENNLHLNIKDIQVQFHRLGDNYLERYNNIRQQLSKTHRLTYDFPFIWENWSL